MKLKSKNCVAHVTLCVMCSICSFFAGCASPNHFRYGEGKRMAIHPVRTSSGSRLPCIIKVLPPIDGRADKSSNEGWSFLSLLPIVPFWKYTNNNMVYFDDAIGVKYTSAAQFNEAVTTHINKSGLALATAEDGSSPLREKYPTYTLQMTVDSIQAQGYRTFYCLGIFPGCYVAILGAPFEYNTSSMALTFTLNNQQGKEILKKSYAAERFYLAGEYYNLQPMTFVGINLNTILDKFANEMAAVLELDISQKR